MSPETILTQTVQNLLQNSLNISISIPTLAIAMDSKINLKICSTPITLPLSPVRQASLSFREEGRYRVLMHYIETLLASSDFEIGGIEGFMGVFLRVINADI